MSKKFWLECFKKFLKFTIPSLITLFTLFGYFFKGFEATIQSLGIIGFILICCLCFLITILLELTGMIKIIDDIGNQCIGSKKNSNKAIYDFYKSYTKSLKNNKHKKDPFIVVESKRNKEKSQNTKENVKEKEILNKKDDFSEKFEYFSIGNIQKSKNYKLVINYPDMVMDVIQEISNIAISKTCESISTIHETVYDNIYDNKYKNVRVNTKLPESIICRNIVEFKSILDLQNILETKKRTDIVISFDGLITGCFLIGFDRKAITLAQRMLESKYKKYYVSLDSIQASYFKEIATNIAGACITALSHMLSLQDKQVEKTNIRVITTSYNQLNDFFNFDSLIAVKNICRIPNLTSVHMYLLFSIHQAKVITDKMLSFNNDNILKRWY